MIETAYGTKIAFTAPHRLATKAGFDILEAGGTAVEAMVAAACLLYTSPSPRDLSTSRMPSSA